VSFRAVRRFASRRTALSVTGSNAPVEDPNLHGITNPRIADASVVPTGTPGNTHAAALAITERAAGPITDQQVEAAAEQRIPR
jgi:choline dehydrogenase-like flavoprotein